MRVLVVLSIYYFNLYKAMKKARYIRVSTNSQNIARQEINQQQDELVFIDKGVSGAIPFEDRPAGRKLLAAILCDTISDLYVSDLSRLGRNTLDILTTIKRLHDRRVNIHVENLNGLKSLNADGTPNQMFSFITTVMSGISQMERETINERISAGIKARKAEKGLNGGRPKGTTENDADTLKKYSNVVKMLKEYPEMKQKQIAGACEVDARTVKKVQVILDKQKG
jgi:DNA invertase Pin-like site-specific DNA recombinase